MSSNTLKGFKNEINYEKINISSLRKLDSGGQMSAVSYGEQNNKFIIQTPLMIIPYAFGTGYNGERSDYMTLSLGDYKSDTKLNNFFNNMKEIENSVLKHIVKNVDNWFPSFSGKSNTVIEQLIDEAFNRFVKHSKDDKYPPTIKVKIPYDNNTSKYDISIVDMYTNEEYNFNEIKDKLRGAYVKICFRISSIYFINKHFGISAKASKIKISFPAKDEDEFRSDSEDESTVMKKMSSAVIEDEDEIDEEIRKEAIKTNKSKDNDKPKDSEEEENDDDNDDSDDDSDDSDEPVKKPAVIKKTQIKSKKSKN